MTVRAFAGSSTQPTVHLARLAMVGGVSHGDGVQAYGGGLYVPPAGDGSPGATVSLDRVAVVGNRADATRTSASTAHTSLVPRSSCGW